MPLVSTLTTEYDQEAYMRYDTLALSVVEPLFLLRPIRRPANCLAYAIGTQLLAVNVC